MPWSEGTDRAGEPEPPAAASRGGGESGGRRATAAVALLLAAAAWSCARPGAPPGAPDETRPPAVRSLFPALDSVVPELSGRAKVEFDEPISAGRNLGRQLVASPAYAYTVSVGHSEISVRPEGGWRPGAVYVLEFPARISDLLNNPREEPVRMVFSTGPPIRPTVVRARLFDRITGEENTDGRILYLAAEDSAAGARDTAPGARDTVPYTAVADTGGVYVLRHVPPGDYWAFGFVDRNRDRRLDRRLEPYDSARVELDSDSAAASLDLHFLEPDSTAPILGRIETPDSVTVRLGFDDHLRPGQEVARLRVRRGADGDSIPIREIRVLTATDTVPEDTLPQDTLPGDTVPGDTLAPDTSPGDTVPRDSAAADAGVGDSAAVAGATPLGGPPVADAAAAETGGADSAVAAARNAVAGGGRPAPARPGAAGEEPPADTTEGPPRPTRILRVRLGEAMAVDDTYRVSVRGVVNMWGLSTDADTTFVFTPPPPDTSAVDSAGVDTLGAGTAEGDTTAADTAAAETPADTAAGALGDPLLSDTTGVLP